VRSPLQAIAGHADIAKMLLARERADAPAIADIDAIKRAATRAEAMMQKVVEFARTSSIDLQRETVDLEAVCAEVVKDLAPVLERASVGLSTACESASDFVLQGDALQLRRLIENLVVNARDVLTGGPASEQAPHIWLKLGVRGGSIVLRVVDNGPGIPDALVERLFSPFVTGKKHGGMGLGLAIVANLVRAHAGTIRVDAHAPEGGAAFVIELPRAVPPELSRPAPSGGEAWG
jgi:signal transduction histidine kinase